MQYHPHQGEANLRKLHQYLYGENENLGTDFYTPDLKVAKTIPYRNNYGYIFTSEDNSWHGLEKKKIINEIEDNN